MNTFQSKGKVVLLSAGPGDLELLTVKAVKALAEAHVLLLDDLVNPEIVTLAPAAKVIHVGKRGGCRSTSQAFICRLMRRYARQGLCVARIKGGEALMFGRAGEEIAFLRKHGVEVQILNGISSALAAAAALGASLTHRDHCHGVTFVTAHTRDGEEPDWATLAAGGTTLAIYMGMSRLESLTAGLLRHLPGTTPAAVVQWVSRSNERQLLTTLDRLAQEACAAGLGSPAILLIGTAMREAITSRTAAISPMTQLRAG